MPYIESFDEFRARIGVDLHYFVIDRRYVFQNGAISDGTYHSGPPTDRAALLKILLMYHRARVEYREDVFRKVKADITTKAEYARLGAGPGPTTDDIRQLQEFQKSVIDARAELNKYRAELQKLLGIDPHAEARERQKHLDEVIGIVQEVATISI